MTDGGGLVFGCLVGFVLFFFFSSETVRETGGDKLA